MGTISSEKTLRNDIKETHNRANYTHTVFVEIGTSQNCNPCHYWSENIHNGYISGEYDFEYVEMIVFDHDGNVLNEVASNWEKIYEIGAYPTSILDGNFKKIVGNQPNELSYKLEEYGNRAVSGISAEISVMWLGDVKIYVNINIENNENT